MVIIIREGLYEVVKGSRILGQGAKKPTSGTENCKPMSYIDHYQKLCTKNYALLLAISLLQLPP